MNWHGAQFNDPMITDTETYIVDSTRAIELAVVRRGGGGSSTCMICAVDFTMKASPLPPPPQLSDIEMNKAQLT